MTDHSSSLNNSGFQNYFCNMILQIIIVTSCLLTPLRAQLSTKYSLPYTECCELKLMDTNLQVAIDSTRVLQSGTFVALKARMCTTSTIYIQIWRRINDSAYEFKWQTPFTATPADTIKAYAVVKFQNNPVTITPDDRLGIYGPSNSELKFSIPYEFDVPSGAMYFSRSRYDTASVFTSGLVIFTDDLRWPRTFNPYVTLCSSLSECPEVLTDQPSMTTPFNPYSGYIPASCCNNIISCDAGNTIKDTLTNQNNQVKNLQETVNNLQKTLLDLLNSTLITGTCPEGFTAGVYGVGSCYIVHRTLLPMAQAVIMCRDKYSARLLNIQSQIEDTFIKEFLLNTSTSDIERFWTSGMYNIILRNWFWYDDDFVTKQPFGDFRNWKDGQEPAATTIYDVCSVFTVNKSQNLDYWEKETCTNSNYYVCEVPKRCP